MSGLGFMVASGMSPESIDAMELSDLASWYEIAMEYQKASNGTIGAGGKP